MESKYSGFVKEKKDKEKSAMRRRMYIILFLISWGIFCVVFYTLPDFLHDHSPYSTGEDILFRLLGGLVLGMVFGGLFGIIYKKRRKIEWGYIIFAFILYIIITIVITYFFADRDLSLVVFKDLFLALIISFPATLILIELLENLLN